MIASDKITSQRRIECTKRAGEGVKVRVAAIVEIAGEKNDFRTKLANARHDVPREICTTHVTEMEIADHSGGASTPRGRKILQFDFYAADPR